MPPGCKKFSKRCTERKIPIRSSYDQAAEASKAAKDELPDAQQSVLGLNGLAWQHARVYKLVKSEVFMRMPSWSSR